MKMTIFFLCALGYISALYSASNQEEPHTPNSRLILGEESTQPPSSPYTRKQLKSASYIRITRSGSVLPDISPDSTNENPDDPVVEMLSGNPKETLLQQLFAGEE